MRKLDGIHYTPDILRPVERFIDQLPEDIYQFVLKYKPLFVGAKAFVGQCTILDGIAIIFIPMTSYLGKGFEPGEVTDLQIGIGAHELAHLYRIVNGEMLEDDDAEELAVNDLALSWGFKQAKIPDRLVYEVHSLKEVADMVINLKKRIEDQYECLCDSCKEKIDNAKTK